MDIRRTPLALFIAAVIASHAGAADQSEFCRNGGSATGYTCDEDKQIPDRAPIDARALASTDEAWMQNKLAEIKAWLHQEKTGEGASTEAPAQPRTEQQVAVRNPAATNPELMRIENMSRNGDHRGAMSAINSYIASNPDSLEAKLTKSLILNNMGESAEAEALLKTAIARYPSSPELYNNLAVLYAARGDHGQAIETLLKAFSTHPTYAQVHQNLRELYAAVASQAYNRALNLNESETAPKLVMLRRTTEGSAAPLQHQPASINTTLAAAAPQPVSKPAPVESTPSVPVSRPAVSEQPVAAAVKKPAVLESKPVVIAESKGIDVPSAETVADKPTAKPAAKPAASGLPDTQLVKEAIAHVNQWANAWAAQDVDGYINAYAAGYQPSANMSHNAWRDQRHDRLTKPTFIKVTLSDVQTRLTDKTTAQVTFNQRYQSNTYQDSTTKQLTLERMGNAWRITDERSL